jgi:hypothetical protein
MKKIPFFLLILPLFLAVMQCGGKKKPTSPDLTDPKYYFPINLTYKWQYVRLGADSIITGDTFFITATSKSVRHIDGINQSGWDMVSLPGGDTSFVFQVADTIFYIQSLHSSRLDPYKILVGPIEAGTFWKDRFSYDFDYFIVGFEDTYSSVAGVTYKNCAKIRRTSSGVDEIKYFWWSTEFGRVKEETYLSEQYLQGEELKSLDKTHVPP